MSDFGMRRRTLGRRRSRGRRMLQATAGAGLAVGVGQEQSSRSAPRAGDHLLARLRGDDAQPADGGPARDDHHRGDAAGVQGADRDHRQVREGRLRRDAREARAPARRRAGQRLLRRAGGRLLLGLRVRPLRLGRGARTADRRHRRRDRSGPLHSRASLDIDSTRRRQDLLRADVPLPDGTDLPRTICSTTRRSRTAYQEQTGQELALPDSVEGYVEMAEAVSALQDRALRRGDAGAAGRPDRDGVLQFPLRARRRLLQRRADRAGRSTTRPGSRPPSSTPTASTTPPSRAPPAPTSNDTMATYSQGKAFSMVSYMFMLSVFNDDDDSAVKGKNTMTVMPGGTRV